MKALFIGQSYIDITFLADEIPTGDEKTVAREYAVAFGGNAVTAAFCCAKLGIVPLSMSQPEFQKYFEADVRETETLAKAAKIEKQ